MSRITTRIAGWVQEAKRRKVWVSVGAYAVIALTIIEFSGAIFEALLLPSWGSRLVTVLLILGFPVVVLLAWIFDVTSEGIKKTDEGPSSGDASAGIVGGGSSSTPKAMTGRSGAPRVRRVSLDAPARAGSSGSVGEVGRGVTVEGEGETDDGRAPDHESRAKSAPLDPERVKQAALGHVRHELKTPINGILGYSEMLLEDLEEESDDESEEIRADLERIRSGGRQLLGLIDQILSPTRIAEDSDSVDLEKASAQIRADLRTPVTSVVGYAELLIETAEESGRDHMVADLERIRSAAERLLALSTDIIQVANAHVGEMGDGRLSQASEIAAGVLSKARSGSQASPREGMGSLLVVDDNSMNRDLLSRQLARAGYMVQTASDGREALGLLEQRGYDLVLLDVIMPEMDGLDVLRSVKADERMAETPIIMLSSLDDMESAIRCIDMGAEDFLSKPFHPTLLQARIGATLEVRRMKERMEATRGQLEDTEGFAARVLRSSFPAAIAERIRQGEEQIVESYGNATVLWCDIEGAARSHARDAGQVAGRMQRLLTTLEAVAAEEGLEAVAQTGDGVVIAGGVPTPTEDHADRVAAAAVSLREALAEDGEFDAPVRVGVDSGEVTGGVLGGERLGYRMWGDPVDLARALGANAPAGRVMVSPGAYRLLRDRWAFATPGVQEIPGRGQMKTYLLEGPV